MKNFVIKFKNYDVENAVWIFTVNYLFDFTLKLNAFLNHMNHFV